MTPPIRRTAEPSARPAPDAFASAPPVLRVRPAFLIGSAIRLSRRSLSEDHAAHLRRELDRLAEAGDLTAPIVLAWLDHRTHFRMGEAD